MEQSGEHAAETAAMQMTHWPAPNKPATGNMPSAPGGHVCRRCGHLIRRSLGVWIGLFDSSPDCPAGKD